MKRLLESEGGGPLVAQARDLLRAAQPEHPSLSAPLQFGRPMRPRLHRARWFERTRVLKPALVAGLVTVAAGAAAQIGVQAWRSNRSERQTAAEPARSLPVAASPGQRRAVAPKREHIEAPTSPRPSDAVPAETPAATTPAPIRARSVAVGQTTRPRARAAELERTSQTDTERPAASQAQLVHSAMRALRSEHDPERAAKLLATYEEQHATGPLAEEALALRIEAALARGDGSAPAYARGYLERYPRGRYRNVAHRALQGADHP